MFVNREAELAVLETEYTSGRASFFVLYGRRRVGKTELLTHFCRDKRTVFFVADLGSEVSQRAALSEAINTVVFGPEQIDAIYPTWEALFQALARAAETERLVVVLDEFQYLVNAHPPIASLLQRYWDQHLRHTRLMLVLCGSYIGMMEENVLGYQAPLYGRRTGQYLLEPLQFKDASLFFPGFSAEDQVRAYAIYGGTPAYLNTIRETESLETNIHEGILRRGSYLYDEVRFILQQELREPRNYFAILQAIAGGKTRLNEIKQTSGIGGATAYLDTLQQLRLIERKIPVTEKHPARSRRGLYRLKDPYLRFWFRYVHPHHSQLERGGSELILKEKVMPTLDHFTSLVFEEVCQQFFWQAGLAGELPFTPIKVGNWWRKSEEIDLVVIGETEVTLVECKWTNPPIGMDLLNSLERKAKYVLPELNGQKVSYALCSRSGFSETLQTVAENRDNLKLYPLETIVT